jgi:hypothetical protein
MRRILLQHGHGIVKSGTVMTTSVPVVQGADAAGLLRKRHLPAWHGIRRRVHADTFCSRSITMTFSAQVIQRLLQHRDRPGHSQ